ncbi:TonB-dependent receptor [Burkholderia anthina]|uniref:TonB-dependent receptor n=1 Tax=Burkholderia anthina TaxID=179879 RepID=UPI001CF1CB59|nr:TonB-dependent receptor [Burkholderia anthina]MCA8093723.1 TonB-dependent receptor [Burkholderia anthina]
MADVQFSQDFRALRHRVPLRRMPLCLACAGLVCVAAAPSARAQAAPADASPAAAPAGGASGTEAVLPAVSVRAVRGVSAGERANFTLPASVSTIDGDTLEASHLDTLGQIAERLPNVYMTSYTQTTPIMTIRGLGIDADESDSTAIPVLVDGVPLFGLAVGQLFDLDQVQVLRGPQSLYAQNAFGGLVNLRSRDPGNKLAGSVMFDYASYGRARTTVSGDVPLTDRTALRIAVGAEHGDGYTENTSLNRDNTAGWNSTFAHLKLLHRDDAGGVWRFGLFSTRSRGGNDYFAPPDLAGRHQSNATDTGTNDVEYTLLSANYDREFGNGTKLAVTLGASRMQWDYWLPTSLFGARNGYDMVTRQLSGDVKLSGKQGRLDWMIGLSDQLTKRDAPYLFDMGAAYLSSTAATLRGNSVATYGEVGWRIAPAWRIAAGMRVQYDRQTLDWRSTQGGMFDADGDGIPDTPFNSVSTVDGASVNHVAALPRLTLEFEPNAQHYGWITLARGYLSPGFNTYAISADKAGQPYGAANSSYIELGYRLRGADDAWELGATLFDAYMHDQQITSSLNGQTVTSNAPRSHTRGAELSGRWRPVRQFEFNAFVGLVDAKYDDYTAGGVDYSGRQFASTPRQSFGLGMTWRPDGHWDLGVNVARQGATNLAPTSTIGNDPYLLVDAHATYRVRRYNIGVYGQNLANAHYYTRALSNGIVVAGNPRVVGVRVGMDF